MLKVVLFSWGWIGWGSVLLVLFFVLFFQFVSALALRPPPTLVSIISCAFLVLGRGGLGRIDFWGLVVERG